MIVLLVPLVSKTVGVHFDKIVPFHPQITPQNSLLSYDALLLLIRNLPLDCDIILRLLHFDDKFPSYFFCQKFICQHRL